MVLNSKYVIIFSILGYGCWSFFLKLATRTLHPFQIYIVNCCVGLLLLPLYIGIVSTRVSQPFKLNGILWAIAATLCATIAAISFIYSIRGGNNVASLSAISSASPIITLMLAALFIGEQITIFKAIGILLIIAGIAVLGL